MHTLCHFICHWLSCSLYSTLCVWGCYLTPTEVIWLKLYLNTKLTRPHIQYVERFMSL